MKNLLKILPLILAIICFVSYTLIGSKIDENGFLQEPFFLIGLGWIFIFMTLIIFGIDIFKKFFRKKV